MNLTFHTLTSASGEYVRDVWLLSSPGDGAAPLCVFLDAEFYLDRLDAPAVIEELIATGTIAPMTYVFVSHRDAASRQQDYLCNDRYATFIARDVVEWMRGRRPKLPAGGHVVCGLSLSGLASASMAVAHPEVFAAALCQSPSFWWNEEAFAWGVTQTQPAGTAFWISVGDQETETGVTHPPTGLRQDVSQIAACRRAVETLQTLGNSVHFHVFAGGHETKHWKAELPAALKWVVDTLSPPLS